MVTSYFMSHYQSGMVGNVMIVFTSFCISVCAGVSEGAGSVA